MEPMGKYGASPLEQHRSNVKQQLRDSSQIFGYMTLQWTSKGKSYCDHGSNVITNAGKVHLLKVVGGDAGFTAISRMAGGDGGCGANPATSALFTPVAFSATDTNLRQPITNCVFNIQTINWGADLNVGARTLSFTGIIQASTLITGDYNHSPYVLNELALKSGAGDNEVIALRAFRSIPFDPADAIEVLAVWTIGFP